MPSQPKSLCLNILHIGYNSPRVKLVTIVTWSKVCWYLIPTWQRTNGFKFMLALLFYSIFSLKIFISQLFLKHQKLKSSLIIQFESKLYRICISMQWEYDYGLNISQKKIRYFIRDEIWVGEAHKASSTGSVASSPIWPALVWLVTY